MKNIFVVAMLPLVLVSGLGSSVFAGETATAGESIAESDRDEAQVAAGDPITVVENYFAKIRAQDLDVANLFHENAELLGLGMRVSGRKAIREFYAHSIETGGPQPSLAGPLITDGRRVAAEIYIDLADGSQLHVVDMFHIENGRIRLLNYFTADEPI